VLESSSNGDLLDTSGGLRRVRVQTVPVSNW